MLGRTHIAVGITISLLASLVFGISFTREKLDSIALAVVVIGALLPDLDMGTSSLAAKFGLLKAKHIQKIWLILLGALAIAVYIYLKNTPFFYISILILLMGFLLSGRLAQRGYFVLRNLTQGLVAAGFIVAAYFYKQPPLVWVGVILLLLLFSKHRGLSHSILFVLGTTFAARSISLYYGNQRAWILFGISMGSHVLADLFTKAGVALLYPFSDNKMKFPVAIKTGGWIENIIFISSWLAAFKLTKLL